MILGASAGATDTGRRRRHNEDSYVCEPPLFAIADGMGGAQAGEVASRLAAAVLEETRGDDLAGEQLVAELIQEANRRVFQRSSEDAAVSGMGTTMTVALVADDAASLVIGHVGDSRAYRIRGGALEQLTHDHSLVGELIRSGRLSPEEAESHPQRSVITRAVGTEPDVDVDTFTTETEPGDIYLLCSDGLTDMLSDAEIQGLVAGNELDRALDGLIRAANSNGGEDNITAVAFEIADGTAATDETARMPAVTDPEPEPAQDDEDTLSGLEAIPAVDTAVFSADELRDHIETAPPARPARGRTRRTLPFLLLVVVLVAIALLVVWGLTR